MDLDTIGRWLGWVVMAGYVVLTATEVPRYFISALKPAPAIDAPASRHPEGLASRRPKGLASRCRYDRFVPSCLDAEL